LLIFDKLLGQKISGFCLTERQYLFIDNITCVTRDPLAQWMSHKRSALVNVATLRFTLISQLPL